MPAVVVAVAAATTMGGLGVIGSAGAQTPPPAHWGPYQWSGGTEKANVRAFWLFDRTGNQQVSDVIKVVADGWNSYRYHHPELPYIAVLKDDAHAGACFVNQTPGWSVASACLIPNNIEGVRAIAARNPDQNGHLIGAAMAISDGLTLNETFTAVCHAMGHILGLDNSTDASSCMSHEFGTDQLKWYDQADADAVLALYAHSDTGATSTTSSSTTTPATSTTTPSTTSTTSPSTTSTSSTSTTLASSTTSTSPTSSTTSTLVSIPPVTLPTTTTTTTGGAP